MVARVSVAAVLASLVTAVAPVAVPAVAAANAPSEAPTAPYWSDTGGGAHRTAVDTTRAVATWTAPVGATTYEVQVSESAAFASTTARRTGVDATYAVFTASDGLAPGRAYYFRTRAVDGSAAGPWSTASPRMSVAGTETGPAVEHAPVAVAPYGEAIPISVTTTCAEGTTCSVDLNVRTTTVANASGFDAHPLTRGAATTLNGQAAVTWTGEVPGRYVTASGIDYSLTAREGGGITHFPGTMSVTGTLGAASHYLHVETATRPIIRHVPVPWAYPAKPLPIELDATCPTATCSVTLYYRESLSTVNTAESAGPVTGWPSMPAQVVSAVKDPAGSWTVHAVATVPASTMTTRGLDYILQVRQDDVRAYSPGTTYNGHYAVADGYRVAWHHVHVLEPSHVVHQPVLTAPYRQDIPISATARCGVAGTCTATLHYRTSVKTHSFTQYDSSPMTMTTVRADDDGSALERYDAVVPARYATTRGVDYHLEITDGATTSWWPGTPRADAQVTAVEPAHTVQHVRVLEPPHIVHVPQLTAPVDKGFTVTTRIQCATEACRVTLGYTADPLAGSAAYRSMQMHRTAVVTQHSTMRVEEWAATIPAAEVTTRGLAYFLDVSDGWTHASFPGTEYYGVRYELDGGPVRGANATPSGGDAMVAASAMPEDIVMVPVRVIEPPHLVPVPAVVTQYGQKPVTIDVTGTCATASCTASIEWRTTTHDPHTAAMTGTDVGTGPAGRIIRWSYTIPASAVTVEGIDYTVSTSDGYVRTTLPGLKVVVPNARQSFKVPAVADTTFLVPSRPCDAPCAAYTGSETSLHLGLPALGSERAAAVRFDLSSVPPGHEVTRATLKLNVTGDRMDLDVEPFTAPWTEAHAGNAPLPAYAWADGVHFLSDTAALGVDITPLVRKWVQSPATNFGMAVLPSHLLNGRMSFASREAAVPGYSLVIDHAAVKDQQAPSVTLTAPVAGKRAFGDEPLRSTPGDDTGVWRVDYFVDDRLVSSGPASSTFDAESLTAGAHQVWARAVDTSGAMKSSPRVTVTAQDPLTSLDKLNEDWLAGILTPDEYVDQARLSFGHAAEASARYAGGEPEEDASMALFTIAKTPGASPEALTRLANTLVPADDLAVDAPMEPMSFAMTSAATTTAADDEDPAIPEYARTTDVNCKTENSQWALSLAKGPTTFGIPRKKYEYCVFRTARFDVFYRHSSFDPDSGVDSFSTQFDGLPDKVLKLSQSFYQAEDKYASLGFLRPAKSRVYYTEVTDRFDGTPAWVTPPLSHVVEESPTTRAIYFDRHESLDYLPRHELFHRVQFDYLEDLSLRTKADFPRTLWWLEATADWAAHQAAVAGVERYRYASNLPDFLAYPERILPFYDRTDRSRAYGTFLLAEWLHSTSPGVVKRSFEQWSQNDTWVATDALDGALGGPGSLASYLPAFWEHAYLLDFQTSEANAVGGWRDQLATNPLTAGDALGGPRPARTPVQVRIDGTQTTQFGSVGPGGAVFLDVQFSDLVEKATLVSKITAAAGDIGDLTVELMHVRTYPNSNPTELYWGEGLIGGTAFVMTSEVLAGATVRVAITNRRIDPLSGFIPFHMDFNVADAGVVLQSGNVRMGLNQTGELNANWVGLKGHGIDGLYQDCLCEGWGIADKYSGVYGTADQAYGSYNLGVKSFTASADRTTATSEVSVTGVDLESAAAGMLFRPGRSQLRVTQTSRPTASPDLFELDVLIENAGNDVANVVYERVMDWDVPPTPFNEFVTIGRLSGPERVLPEIVTTDDGLSAPAPLSEPLDRGRRGFFVDDGPRDHGALFQFRFGELRAGETRRLKLYYGVAATESSAMAALALVGADLYSLGQSNGGQTTGAPGTMIFGYRAA